MIFLFAYGSYAFSEALKLSGIMSLFFCGVVLSHYNNHNLSPTSQVTAHNIFKCMAGLSEFFVYLYMGMGFFTGRFRNWNFIFIVLCIGFCLFSRLCNSFPFSYVANFWRIQKIPFEMKCAIWFAGLRGAIAFALSQNMPGENTDLYVSTTLSIVIFTTVVCGGLTEPMLSKFGMRGQPLPGADGTRYEQLNAPLDSALTDREEDGRGLSTSDAPNQAARTLSARAFWSKFDAMYMQPFFGGDGEIDDELDINVDSQQKRRSAAGGWSPQQQKPTGTVPGVPMSSALNSSSRDTTAKPSAPSHLPRTQQGRGGGRGADVAGRGPVSRTPSRYIPPGSAADAHL